MNSTVTEASTSTSTDTPSTFNTVFLYNFLPLLLVVLVICVSTTIIYCYIASKVRAAQKSQSQLFLTSRSLNNNADYPISIISTSGHQIEGRRHNSIQDKPPGYNTLSKAGNFSKAAAAAAASAPEEDQPPTYNLETHLSSSIV